MLQSLELGNCDKIEPSSLFDTLKSLKNLKYLRLEKGKFDVSVGEMKNLTHLRVLELIDFEMVQGFGKGLVELQNIRKLLLIPTYTDEVSKNFVKSMYAGYTKYCSKCKSRQKHDHCFYGKFNNNIFSVKSTFY